LKFAIDLNSRVQIACLPLFESAFDLTMPNTKSFAVGWGATSFGGSTSNNLRNVRLNIYDGEMCSKFANTDWTKQM
jgi:hypothetical protein